MDKQKKKKKNKPGDKFGKWVLESPLGGGGNGDVWKATTPGSSPQAIKILRTITPQSYERFKVEIEALDKLGKLEGIVPLLEKYIPENSDDSTPWYVMPIATPFKEYKKGKPKVDLALDFVKLAEVLEKLHSKGISHRDIKPANFLYLNGRLCLSDFGLVKYPGRQDITLKQEDVGAKFTMAPEMRRTASEADGMLADVYSLAKSLWIALTGEDLGFDGQYNPSSTLSLKNYLGSTYTTTLDQLLVECTDSEPSKRPSALAVASRINEWLLLINSFEKRNLIEWAELTQKLFPLGAPSRTSWSQVDAICAVLSEIAKVPALNHMFYPSVGGNTITGVSRAAEKGMIELHIGEKHAEILKPEKLTYESFSADHSWSYFRLEVAPVNPIGIDNALGIDGISEALTEITPGKYYPYRHWAQNEFMDEPLPKTARPVDRFVKGCFVFFSTRSIYNRTPATYDARHNKMTEEKFRSYIQEYAIKDGMSPGDKVA